MLFGKKKKQDTDQPQDQHVGGLHEAVRSAADDSPAERIAHLRSDTPDEPARPGAVNLERTEPVTDAARRRDTPRRDAVTEDAFAGEVHTADYADGLAHGRGTGASETTSLQGGENLQGRSAASVPQDRVLAAPENVEDDAR